MLSSYESIYLGLRRIVVISPNLAHPRYHRRVEALLSAGYQVTVYSFERAYYNCNSFPPECELINLGQVKDGHYFQRIPKILDAARRIWFIEHTRSPASLVYAFELDSAILGSIAVNNTGGIIYEIGDLRSPSSKKGILGRVTQMIEDILFYRCSLVVITSQAFLDHYFKKRYYDLKIKTLVVENKLPKTLVDGIARPTIKPSCYPIRIGYIGLLRYETTLAPLLRIIAKYKDRYSLHIYGDGPLRSIVEQNSLEFDNIHYYGPFQNPKDLGKIYNSIDICYVVYDNSDINVKLALPNKLYESTFFCVPMLVASETVLYEHVKNWNVGWAVDPKDSIFLDKFFNELSLVDIDQKKRNAAMINQEHMIENYEELNNRILSLFT